MEITSINTESLSRMFLAGAKNLEAKKEWINELNVFPVPDGDTGTNMSMTIMSAAREVGALSNPTMKELAKARKMRGVSTLKNLQKQFLPVPFVGQEVIPALFYPSCSAVSVKLSKSMMR